MRAHFIPAGETALELLEATSEDSPIAKYLAKRGPGLHHITLAVPDIRAALARLKERGIRLIDEEPRPGAHGSLVAFVHPGSAHGVLVELKERPGLEARGSAIGKRQPTMTFGDLVLTPLWDGSFKLDGGAMFGVVPKPLWEKRAPADERNRIRLGLRPLLVQGEKTMLIDAGIGGKMDAKSTDIYAIDRSRNIDHSLADAGVSRESVEIVLATHLHFDHAGGFTSRDGAGNLSPAFPRARYVVRTAEWDDAAHPNERNRASYLKENFVPLADAGVLDLVAGERTHHGERPGRADRRPHQASSNCRHRVR